MSKGNELFRAIEEKDTDRVLKILHEESAPPYDSIKSENADDSIKSENSENPEGSAFEVVYQDKLRRFISDFESASPEVLNRLLQDIGPLFETAFQDEIEAFLSQAEINMAKTFKKKKESPLVRAVESNFTIFKEILSCYSSNIPEEDLIEAFTTAALCGQKQIVEYFFEDFSSIAFSHLNTAIDLVLNNKDRNSLDLYLFLMEKVEEREMIEMKESLFKLSLNNKPSYTNNNNISNNDDLSADNEDFDVAEILFMSSVRDQNSKFCIKPDCSDRSDDFIRRKPSNK